jgi:hypothetical protein
VRAVKFNIYLLTATYGRDSIQFAMRSIFTLALVGVLSTSAFASFLPLDPGVALTAFTSNSNDGYSAGRGMWFQANNALTVTGAGFFNGFSDDDSFTMNLWTADNTGSNLHVSNLGSFTIGSPAPGDHYVNGSFSSSIGLSAGSFYYLEVVSGASFDTNYFYNWNGPGVNIGDVTVLDGGLGNDLGNTVAPGLQLDIEAVPEPASFAVLGLGALALLRRRRTTKA